MKLKFTVLFVMFSLYSYTQEGIKIEQMVPIYTGFDGYQTVYQYENKEFSFMHKNDDYQVTTQFEYIYFKNLADLVEFFEIIVEVSETGKQYSIEINGQCYRIEQSSKGVYIFPSTGYFTVRKKHAQGFLNYVKNEILNKN
jgi:hypothetical protein